MLAKDLDIHFSERLIAWQRQYGRHDLPWQVRDPYCIWLSEIMLQQTQVSTVKNYYAQFLAAFPTVGDLAAASQEQVLALWAGLGYYSRARNLHKAAQQIMQDFGGQFPQQRLELEKLCGVGRSTAAAISAFAFGARETILDGNVKRVLARVFAFEGEINHKTAENELWRLAEKLLPERSEDMAAYTQGLMDLGATVCRRKPDCSICPMADICQAKQQGRTAELPKKKAAVKVQYQTMIWLCLRSENGAYYLERRPQNGIWAGLYCFPTFENFEQLQQYLDKHAINRQILQTHSTVKHRLTHRILEITPLSCTLNHCAKLPEKGVWLNPKKSNDVALPKPVQDYMQQHLSNPSV